MKRGGYVRKQKIKRKLKGYHYKPRKYIKRHKNYNKKLNTYTDKQL